MATKRSFQQLYICLYIVFGCLTSISASAQTFIPQICAGASGLTAATTTYVGNTVGPMYTNASGNAASLTAIVFPKTEIATLIGTTITAVNHYKVSTGPLTGTPNLKIWIGEADFEFTSGTSGIYSLASLTSAGTSSNGVTLVYDGNPTSDVGFGSGWKKFSFTTPFNYTGSRNLLVIYQYQNLGNPFSSRLNWAYEDGQSCASPLTKHTKFDTSSSAAVSNTSKVSSDRPFTGFDYTASTCVTPSQPSGINLTPGPAYINCNFSAVANTRQYLVVRTSGSTALNTNPTDGISYAAGSTLGNGTVVFYGAIRSFNDTVTPNTQYTYTVFGSNAGCTSGPLYNTTSPPSATATATGGTKYVYFSGSNPYLAFSPTGRAYGQATDTLIFDKGGSITLTTTPMAANPIAKIVVTNNTNLTLTNVGDLQVSTLLQIDAGSTLNLQNATSLSFTAGTSAIANIYGTLSTLFTGGSPVGAQFNTANSVTNVWGTLSCKGSKVISGTTGSLFMNSGSVYSHSMDGGVIPSATWSPTSTINISGQSSGTISWNTGAKPGNVNWNNTTASVTTFNWQGRPDTIQGNFSYAAGNLNGTLAFGTSDHTTTILGNFTHTSGPLVLSAGAQTLNVVGNVFLNGGTLNLNSGAGVALLKVGGNLTQAAGHTLTQTGSGTQTSLQFSGSSAQAVSFGGTVSNSIGLIVDNPAGVVLNSNFGLSNAAAEMRRGSLSGTGALVYDANSTLIYSSASAQTTGSNEFPASNGPSRLRINNSSANGVTLHAPRYLSNALDLVKGKLNTTATNVLTLGASGSAYSGTAPTGSNSSYVNGPLAIVVNSVADISRTFAVGDATAFRPVVLSNFNTGGTLKTLTASVINGPSGGTGVLNLCQERYFRLQNVSGIQSASQPVISLGYDMNRDFLGAPATVKVNQSATANGTYTDIGHSAHSGGLISSGTSNPLSPSGGEYFILSGAAVWKQWSGAVSNNWGDAANWIPTGVPGATDYVRLNSGAAVQVNINNAIAGLKVEAGARLFLNADTLLVDSFIENNGRIAISDGLLRVGPVGGSDRTMLVNDSLDISGGTLEVNGGLVVSAGASMLQSSGTVMVDGNAGGSATGSYANGPIVSFSPDADTVALTGGIFRIVDPQAVAVGPTISSGSKAGFGFGHTIVLGDANSSDAGSSNGFLCDAAALSNVVIETALNGTNRWVSGSFKVNGDLTINSGADYRQASLPATQSLTGNLVIQSGGAYRQTSASCVLSLMGNLTVNNAATLTLPGTLIFGSSTEAASAAQQLNSTGTLQNALASATANLANLQVNNSSVAGVTFNTGNISYSGDLKLTNGKLNMGANTLTQQTGGTISQAGGEAGWVVGTLQRFASTGAVDLSFPIGDASNYTPFYVRGAAGAVTAPGALTVSTYSGSHPSLALSNIVAANSINRYFTVTATNGISFSSGSLSVAMFWSPADMPVAATPASYGMGKFSSSTWTYPTVVNASNYYLQASGISSFSDFVAGQVAVALAVKLGDISARNYGKKNLVTWSTLSETPGTIFELQRSIDGMHFQTLSILGCYGRASEYDYWDQQPAVGVNYYRLKISEQQAGAVYSKVVQATVLQEAATVSIYPNPFADFISVSVTQAPKGEATIAISDMAGRQVKTVYTSAGYTTIDLRSLPKGNYFLNYQENGHSVTSLISKL